MTARARLALPTFVGAAVLALGVAAVGVGATSGGPSAAAAHPRAVTGAALHTVQTNLPSHAGVAKRVVKVRFSPRHPVSVKLQRLLRGHYVTVRTVRHPKGTAVRIAYRPKHGRTIMRAVVTWKHGRRAASPPTVTQWGPAPKAAPTPSSAPTPTVTPTPTPSATITVTPTPTGTWTPAALDANGDPTANIDEPSGMNACWSGGPTAPACAAAEVAAINLGRAREGLAAFALPGGWATLTPAQQLLVISNDERTVRGLRTISGLSPTLNAAAQTGANNNADPTLAGWTVDGHAAWGWASNWAITPGGPLYSDFLWMYDDGLNAGNLDCTPGNTSGCWGHRHNILAWGDPDASTMLLLGAAEATTTYGSWSGLSDATLLVKVSS